MKNNIYKYAFLLFLGIFYSCEGDLLDKSPTTTLNPATFWQTENDAQLAVNALYQYMPGYFEIDYDNMSDISCRSDENRFTMNQMSNDDGYFLSRWEEGYEAIRAANYFLENVILVPDLDTSVLARLQAEARFIRALRYTYLVMQFGDVPFIDKTLTADEAANVTITNKEGIWDFIEEELTEIVGSLPSKSEVSNEPERITEGAALGFKARAMLYAGRYTSAKNAAKAVMDLGDYDLYPDYRNLFIYAGENNSEVIMQRGYAQDILPSRHPELYGSKEGFDGRVRLSITGPLVDSYETTTGKGIFDVDTDWDSNDPYRDRDPRLGATVWLPVYRTGSYSDVRLSDGLPFDTRPGQPLGETPDYVDGSNVPTQTGFMLKKWLDPIDSANKNNSGINFISLRYADILLMYAEAKIELGELDQSVVDAINAVRQRPSVNMPPISLGDQATMRDLVRHERKVELAMEGLRFYDVRRWRIGDEVMNGVIVGMRHRPFGNETAPEETVIWEATLRVWTDDLYEFPIPFREVEINPNLVK